MYQPWDDTPQIITAKVSAKTASTIERIVVSSGVPPSLRPRRKCSRLAWRRSATIEALGSARTFSA
jgi:hypothetical protein